MSATEGIRSEALKGLRTSALNAEAQQMVKEAQELSYFAFKTKYVDHYAAGMNDAPTIIYDVKLLSGSVDILAKVRATLQSWAREADKQKKVRLCREESRTTCSLFVFTQRTPRGLRVMIPGGFASQPGQWGVFNAAGDLLERGIYLEGDPAKAYDEAFKQNMPEKTVTAQKIHTPNGDIYLLPK